MHARTHERTHARTYALTHARIYACTQGRMQARRNAGTHARIHAGTPACGTHARNHSGFQAHRHARTHAHNNNNNNNNNDNNNNNQENTRFIGTRLPLGIVRAFSIVLQRGVFPGFVKSALEFVDVTPLEHSLWKVVACLDNPIAERVSL